VNFPIIPANILSSTPTNSATTQKFVLGSSLACDALSGKSAASGEDGRVSPSAAKCGGSVARGSKCNTGLYSELYTWKTPYATKYLGYGEAGKPAVMRL
jgi:hypothetical protein